MSSSFIIQGRVKIESMTNKIYFGDNLKLLESMPEASVDLIYIDPPFNTGRVQARKRLRTVRTEDGQGDRIGFGGKAYMTEVLGVGDYQDSFHDFEAFIRPRLEQAHRVLKDDGSLYFHIDYREELLQTCWMKLWAGELPERIIWAYDFGGRPRNRWPAKR